MDKKKRRKASKMTVSKKVISKKKPFLPEGDNTPTAGRIKMRKQFDIFADAESYSMAELGNYDIQQRLMPLDKKGNALTAADLDRMREDGIRKKRRLLPVNYANTMQHIDYRIYESLLKHTFIGALADSFVKYLVGTGFSPELELINPDVDDEMNKQLIADNQIIITKLNQIDNQVDVNESGHLDANFKQKISAMIMSTLMFNRGALLFDYEHPVKIDGVEYTDIPTHLMFAHAQDLGIIELDQQTRRLKGVQWRQSFKPFESTRDMIYLWNPMTSSKFHNVWFYGTSMISAMIPPSKILRQLVSEDFPAMARNAWATPYLLVVNNEGQTAAQKRREYEEVTNNLEPGTVGALMKNPDDVALHNINFDPRISDFQQLFESMVKLCISMMGLPQVGFYDEAAANRATMVGKIQLTMRTTIEPMREWIGEAITQQWYMRWFRLLYKDNPEVLNMFKIKLSWKDLHISEWYDSIEAMLKLDGRAKLKNTAFGEGIGLDNYTGMIDPTAEVAPGGQQNQMSMKGQDGESLEIKKNNAPIGGL